MRMPHIVICGLSRSTICFHIISKTARFSKKKVTEHKTCVLIFFTTFVWNISHSKKKLARYDSNFYWSSCKVPFIIVRFSWKLNFLDIFSKKCTNIKFHENPSSGSRVVPCGRTDRRKDMTKLIVAFRNFTNAPKKTKSWPAILQVFFKS